MDLNSNDRTRPHTDGLILTMENCKHYSAETLQKKISNKHDNDLVNLALLSPQYESIVREIFANRYTDKYFEIKGDKDRHQSMYSKIFNLFGNSITSVEVFGFRHIDDNHWVIKLMDKHTPNLKKLCFKKCFFTNVDNFLLRHMSVTHLALHDGSCEWKYQIQLPVYRELRTLEIVGFSDITKSSLEQVLCNNPQMERLILRSSGHIFSLTDIIALIHKYLKNLKHLNIMDGNNLGMNSLQISLDKFVNGLASLESFGMAISRECERGLLRRLNSSKTIKHLELYIFSWYPNREMIELISSFNQIEALSLLNCPYQENVETIVENMPNLRCMFVSYVIHYTNAQILSLLRKCKHLDKLIIESETPGRVVDDYSIYRKNLCFHDEFIAAMPNPNFTLEFHENGEIIGMITKEEIIWRNKLLHWIGYDPNHSRSTLRLLDLATISKKTLGKHKQPLNLIFNYLDVESLYAFAMTCKVSLQLVHKYVQQRCKQPSKKNAKRRSIDREKFYITDEFGINYNALQIAKSIRYLDVKMMDFYGARNLLKEIDKHCKFITKLCFRTRYRIDPENFILAQVRHFIFYGYGLNKEYIFHCNLRELSRKCPNLEIFEIRTAARLYTGHWRKKNILFKNLQKFKFKPFDKSEVEIARELFKNSDTEVIIDC